MRTVREIFRVRETKGDVGIEIETEGRNLPHTGEYWNVTHDGSLRGESIEYVLKKPMSLLEAGKALDYLGHAYKANKAQIADSPRCGVHVHVNCQELTITELYTFITLYLTVEDLLVRWCGKYREGNLFCLRARDAEYLLYVLEQALIGEDYRRRFSTDNLRYAAMNLKALPTYGSLEFRAMRGTADMGLIHKWASVLVHLRDYAKKLNDPVEVISSMSMGGAETFLRDCLGDFAEQVLEMTDYESLLYSGVRRAQEIAFCADWEELKYPKRMVGGIEIPRGWEDPDFPPMDL